MAAEQDALLSGPGSSPAPEIMVAAPTAEGARRAGLAAAAAPVHAMLRGLAEVDLGETPPASSFDPSWDGPA